MDSQMNEVKITIRSDWAQTNDRTDSVQSVDSMDSFTLTLTELKQRLDEKLGEAKTDRAKTDQAKTDRAKTDQAQNEYSILAVYRTLFHPHGDASPSFFEVCAGDGFYARIPMKLAEQAVLVFPETTHPTSGGTRGVRLFVREGESACLNVKSIADVLFGCGEELDVPTFGSKLPGNPKVCKNQE